MHKNETWKHNNVIYNTQAPDVQTLDSGIHRMKIYTLSLG